MSVTPFRWGILGAGGIAEQFTRDVLRLEDHRVVAVGSRTQVKADAFADKFAIGHRHDSYQKLVNDPDVDGVYVATHHPMHMRDTLLALNAGKPVLCEKPFAMSYDETKTMIDTARSKNLLLMEAMWARYLPHMIQIREIIKSGILGEIISVRADHGQWFVKDPKFRLFDPEFGGGALFDLGIYPVSFTHLVLGKPKTITAVSKKAFTGVDGNTSAIFTYENDAIAMINTTTLALTSNTAVINGRLGRIEIDTTFYRPTSFRVIMKDGAVTEYPKNYPGNHDGLGLREEVVEFGNLLRAGKTESDEMPLDETVLIMQTLDEIRKQIGLKYDYER
jgi:predicted dehydrogenase